MFTISRSQKWFLKIRASTMTMTAIIATRIIGLAIAMNTGVCDLSIRSPAKLHPVWPSLAAGGASCSWQIIRCVQGTCCLGSWHSSREAQLPQAPGKDANNNNDSDPGRIASSTNRLSVLSVVKRNRFNSTLSFTRRSAVASNEQKCRISELCALSLQS